MENTSKVTETINEDDLFVQIRTAHRLLAAYYQRLLPTIEAIAKNLELNFYAWQPSEYDVPCRFATNIFERSQWDLLPANCTQYLFFSAQNKSQLKAGEYMLEFHIISDSGILKENLNSAPHQADALNLSINEKQAQSLLRVNLYAPSQDSQGYWYDDLFRNSQKPNYSTPPCILKNNSKIPSYATGIELPLAKLTKDNAIQTITNEVQDLRDELLQVIQSKQ